jgi:hypothetical protein
VASRAGRAGSGWAGSGRVGLTFRQSRVTGRVGSGRVGSRVEEHRCFSGYGSGSGRAGSGLGWRSIDVFRVTDRVRVGPGRVSGEGVSTFFGLRVGFGSGRVGSRVRERRCFSGCGSGSGRARSGLR